MTIKITKGLDLSLEGEVNHQVLPEVKNLTSRVAVLGKDFHGIRPTMFVSEGQQVSQGEKLFEDKKNTGYFHLSPVNGTISEINRGDRRSFLSMVIEKSNDDATFEIDTTFESGDGFNDSVRLVRLQDDGRILVGGFFTKFNGKDINRVIKKIL